MAPFYYFTMEKAGEQDSFKKKKYRRKNGTGVTKTATTRLRAEEVLLGCSQLNLNTEVRILPMMSNIRSAIFSGELILGMLFGLSLIIGQPALAGDSPAPDSDPMPPHWAYMGVEGPQHWGMLTPEYHTCESGSHQSPIDIAMPKPGQHQEQLTFHYQPAHLHELNNGHTIQVSHVSGSHLTVDDHSYKLRQFHFHAPGEHRIEHREFLMEMHLVHQDAAGRILVVAVLMVADARQPVLSGLWEWLPKSMGKNVSLPLRLNVGDLLPANTHHYRYSGSLTTPPCTEGVQWIILKEYVHITRQEVDDFQRIIGRNARSIQPGLNRAVEDH